MRHKGEPLTSEGFFGITYSVQGDLDWFHKSLQLRVAPGGNLPCCWDDANRSSHPFLDLRPDAAWMGT
eukprot:2108804-Alexandrium_andersonii.AAC.1